MKEYVKDGDNFYLVHDMVSSLDRMKKFDAAYESRDAHKGVFKIKYEGEWYNVTVSKTKKVHESSVGSDQINCKSYKNDNSVTTAYNNNRNDEIDGFIAILI